MNGKVEYALEDSAFIAGSAIQWLRDEFRLIDKAADVDGGAAANNLLMQFQADILGVPVESPGRGVFSRTCRRILARLGANYQQLAG
jgi:glycerol kinase